MDILCLDLEGVLVPEVWQAVAQATKIDALAKTTRDIPDYDELMKYRLDLLDTHNIGLSAILRQINRLAPLPGARDFLEAASEQFQLAIISDTFYEFAGPLMAKLGNPLLLCHKLTVEDDRIVSYNIRQPDPKRCSVQAFHSLKYTVFAAGDSFNDVSMLEEADHGFFFCAPTNVIDLYPQYPLTNNYAELLAALTAAKAAR